MTITMEDVPNCIISRIPWGDIDMNGMAPSKLVSALKVAHTKAVAVPSTEVAAVVSEPTPAPVPAANETTPEGVSEAIPDLPLQPQFMGLYSAILARIQCRKNPAPAEEAIPAEAVHEEAKAPVAFVQKFRVMLREYDDRGLHGASYLTDVGIDGKPKVVPTQCPLKAVLRYLKETRRSQDWLWTPLEKSPNMHSLKQRTVIRKGEKMSLWDALATDSKQKVAGLFMPQYWDKSSGEWIGYFLESA